MRKVLAGLGLLLSIVVGWQLGRAPGSPRLVIFDVGQGDAALAQGRHGAILIDAGPALRGVDMGERVVVPRLRALGITRLDAILISHPDLDHSGGLRAVRRRYPSAQVLISREFSENQDFLAQLKEAGVEPKKVVWLPRRAELAVGDVKVRVWCPPWDPGDNDNSGSVFARVQLDQAVAVFTGDANAEQEQMAAPLDDWRADLIHLGHHGSRTSTGDAWLRETKPREAVVSVGRRNVYRHPHPSVVQRVQKAGLMLWRTDEQGEISFVPQGSRFRGTLMASH